MTAPAQVMLTLVGLMAAGQAPPAGGLKERAVLKGHSDGVTCLAFSPDGKILASTCLEVDTRTPDRWADLRLWDAATGNERTALKCHKGGITCMAFSADGKLLATGSSDDTLKLWDVVEGREGVRLRERFTSVRPSFDLRCVAFSPDGKRLGSAGGREVRVWDVASRSELFSFYRLVGGYSPAFSPDLGTLASPNYQDVDLWDVATGKERLVLPEHRGSVVRVAFSADGQTLAAASHRYEDGGKFFGEVRLWDVVAGKERTTLRGHADFLVHLALSADGRTLAVGGSKEPGRPGELKVLDLASGRLLGAVSYKENRGSVASLAINPDGKVLAAGYGDGTVRIWDVPEPRDRTPPAERRGP